MRITLFSIGTQGDVRPFVALGLGLAAQGHQVRIASGAACRELVVRCGLEFAPLTADFLEAMAKDPGVLQRGKHPLTFLRTARQLLAEMSVSWPKQGLAAAEGQDLLIGNGMASMLAGSLAEKLGIGFLETQLQPVTPCPDIPPMVVTPKGERPWGPMNLALAHFYRLIVWQMLRAAIDPLRRALALPTISWRGPYRGRDPDHYPLLYGFSPTLLPPSPHWPAGVHVAGNWFLDDADWQPPPALQAFLAAGEKPVYIGFGSMVSGTSAALTDSLLAALRRSGHRAILATGWGGLAESDGLGEQIFQLKEAPHHWLFPRVSAAIHHGGVGTTAATLRAGIPSVVIPFFGDQSFWAWRLQRLGVAPPALSATQLDVDAIVRALETALLPATRQRAAALGEVVAGEQGIASAITQMQRWGLLA